jgi:hypothetical protein
VISLVMALLSFVESAPRAYRLKVGNADLFRNSTEPGTSPSSSGIALAHTFIVNSVGLAVASGSLIRSPAPC